MSGIRAFGPTWIRKRGAFAVLVALVALASGRARATQPMLTAPEVVERVDAVYPAAALVERRAGTVVLLVNVGADGAVGEVSVAESVAPDLDAAATEAVRRWRFRPAQRDGQAIASRIRVPIHFVLPALAEAAPPKADAVPPVPTAPTASEPPAEKPTEKAPDKGAEKTLEVTVLGRTPPKSRGASDFQLEVGALAQVPRKSATELLKLAPGILLTNDGGEGHAEQIFLRGFDAREGQDVEFSVGGVPINESGNLHGNGYADLHFLIPELVEGLRVVEGPFDPRQGNYAVAGSADFDLGLRQRGLTAKVGVGSFGTKRGLLTWGPGTNSHTFAGVELYQTDGFGQNRDAQRAAAIAQSEGHVGDALYRLTTTAYTTSYHSAGVVRQDDFAAGRIGFLDTYDHSQGGDASRYSIAADLVSKVGAVATENQIFFVWRTMRLRENFTGFLLDTQEPIQNLHSQRGDLLDLEVGELTLGARGSARTRATILGQLQELELGYFARGDKTTGTQYRIEAATGHPYKLETDLESTLGDIGLYGDLNLKPSAWLALRGGLRADLFTFDVLDRCAVDSVAHPSRSNPPGDASCLTQQDFGRYREPVQRASTASSALLPRASVLVGPIADVTFSASYGQGVRSIDPSYISQDRRTPFASIAAYEGGAAYARSSETMSLVARAVFFRTEVDHDLIFSETAGRNTIGGGTARTGALAAARVAGRFFDESANVTWVRSTFDDTGLLVPYVPDLVVRSDSAVFGELPLSIDGTPLHGAAGAGVTYVGRRALPYGQRSDYILTLDLSARLRWRAVELGAEVSNLLDRRYRLGEFNYASDFQSQPQPTLVPVHHFSAGAPRAVMLTLAITAGGPS